MLVTIETIKTHLRLPTDADSELDPYLEQLHDAAKDYIEKYIGRELPWVDVDDEDGDSNSTEEMLPSSVLHALLILIAEFFENREQQVIGAIMAENPIVLRLLHFYRTGLGI